MRRLAIYLLVAVLMAASLPVRMAYAQEQAQESVPELPDNRDLTPYVVGLGAIMGVIAFNIAAPPAASLFAAIGRSLRNIAAVTQAARARAMTRLVTAPAAAAVAPVAEAVEAAPAAEAATAAQGAAPAAQAASAAPMVPPLTVTMLAQAQIAGVAAAAAGAALGDALYVLFTGPGETAR